MSIIFERMPPTPSGVRYIQTAYHDERNENKNNPTAKRSDNSKI